MELVYLYCVLTLGQGLFLSIYLLRKQITRSSVLLSIIIIIEVFTLYDEIFIFFTGSNLSIWLYYIGTPLMAAVGPLILGYIYFNEKTSAEIRWDHMLHFIPAIIAILVAGSNYHILSVKEKYEYIAFFQEQLRQGAEGKSTLELLINNVFRLYTVTYLIIALAYLKNSKMKSKATVWFSKLLIYGFIAIIVTTFVLEWLPASTESVYRFAFFLIIFSSHIFGLTYIYFNPPKYIVNADKYRKSGLNREEEETVLKGLVQLMENDEVFRDSLITLPKLAKKLGTNGHYLSQVINGSFKKSFNELINDYRVKAACKSLEQHKEKSVEEIAEISGFASLSTFFRIFKKATGLTPAKYRELHSVS